MDQTLKMEPETVVAASDTAAETGMTNTWYARFRVQHDHRRCCRARRLC